MRLSRAKGVAGVAALCAAAIAVGCGDDDSDVNNNAESYDGTDAEVAAVIDELGQAGRDGDGELICQEVFAPELTEFIESESGQSCPSEVDENVPEGEYELDVSTIEIQDEAATVVVHDHKDVELTVRLQQIDGEWRVAQVLPRL